MTATKTQAASRAVSRITTRLENAESLDAPAESVADAASKVLSPGGLRDLLSGSWLGHPSHPMLIALPLGFWGSAGLLDLAGQQEAARTLTGAGVVATVPTALTGLSDWLDTAGAERRVGLVHMGANTVAALIFAGSWAARRSGRHRRGAVLGLLGTAAVSAGGWLGGHLSYALGVGVDTNAFDAGAQDWTDLGVDGAGIPADGSPVKAQVGPTPVVACRDGGSARVLADRCSHRGGPLSEGEVSDGCITCPWHGSRFELSSGEVVRGPAVAPQPAYEVREEGARVMVSRSEERALRTNSVKAPV